MRSEKLKTSRNSPQSTRTVLTLLSVVTVSFLMMSAKAGDCWLHFEFQSSKKSSTRRLTILARGGPLSFLFANANERSRMFGSTRNI